MTKKAESVIAPRFFAGGYDGKGRKRRTMWRKWGLRRWRERGLEQKRPKMSHHDTINRPKASPACNPQSKRKMESAGNEAEHRISLTVRELHFTLACGGNGCSSRDPCHPRHRKRGGPCSEAEWWGRAAITKRLYGHRHRYGHFRPASGRCRRGFPPIYGRNGRTN